MPTSLKPRLERITPEIGQSFNLRVFRDPNYCNKPHWHFHPEYEIVYISNGRGKRHIGEHISYYDHGDLIFLGPDLPHFGFTEETVEEHVEIVCQMKKDFLGPGFFELPELGPIKRLFERSHRGISFSGNTMQEAGRILRRMLKLEGMERLLELLKLLHMLAQSDEFRSLQINGFGMEVSAREQDRIQRVFNYVEKHFQRSISLEEISKQINMTPPAFARYFKKLTKKTFTQFVNESRIAHATRLLADEDLSIAEVSLESGFNNLSHFNRQFKQMTGNSPRDYRKSLKKVVD